MSCRGENYQKDIDPWKKKCWLKHWLLFAVKIHFNDIHSTSVYPSLWWICTRHSCLPLSVYNYHIFCRYLWFLCHEHWWKQHFGLHSVSYQTLVLVTLMGFLWNAQDKKNSIFVLILSVSNHQPVYKAHVLCCWSHDNEVFCNTHQSLDLFTRLEPVSQWREKSILTAATSILPKIWSLQVAFITEQNFKHCIALA